MSARVHRNQDFTLALKNKAWDPAAAQIPRFIMDSATPDFFTRAVAAINSLPDDEQRALAILRSMFLLCGGPRHSETSASAQHAHAGNIGLALEAGAMFALVTALRADGVLAEPRVCSATLDVLRVLCWTAAGRTAVNPFLADVVRAALRITRYYADSANAAVQGPAVGLLAALTARRPYDVLKAADEDGGTTLLAALCAVLDVGFGDSAAELHALCALRNLGRQGKVIMGGLAMPTVHSVAHTFAILANRIYEEEHKENNGEFESENESENENENESEKENEVGSDDGGDDDGDDGGDEWPATVSLTSLYDAAACAAAVLMELVYTLSRFGLAASFLLGSLNVLEPLLTLLDSAACLNSGFLTQCCLKLLTDVRHRPAYSADAATASAAAIVDAGSNVAPRFIGFPAARQAIDLTLRAVETHGAAFADVNTYAARFFGSIAFFVDADIMCLDADADADVSAGLVVINIPRFDAMVTALMRMFETPHCVECEATVQQALHALLNLVSVLSVDARLHMQRRGAHLTALQMLRRYDTSHAVAGLAVAVLYNIRQDMLRETQHEILAARGFETLRAAMARCPTSYDVNKRATAVILHMLSMLWLDSDDFDDAATALLREPLRQLLDRCGMAVLGAAALYHSDIVERNVMVMLYMVLHIPVLAAEFVAETLLAGGVLNVVRQLMARGAGDATMQAVGVKVIRGLLRHSSALNIPLLVRGGHLTRVADRVMATLADHENREDCESCQRSAVEIFELCAARDSQALSGAPQSVRDALDALATRDSVVDDVRTRARATCELLRQTT